MIGRDRRAVGVIEGGERGERERRRRKSLFKIVEVKLVRQEE